jgi:phosphatidylglycerol lysyltransferase
VSATDFALATLVLYVLLPSDSLNYSTVLVSYMGAMVVVVVLHVPGGFGVLEYFVIELLANDVAEDETLLVAVFSGLVFFRLIYYFAPFLIALTMYLYEEYLWFQNSRNYDEAEFGGDI